MSTYDASWNPTTAAAAKNEGHIWPTIGSLAINMSPCDTGEMTQVHLGGQAPMFIHTDIADPGLVRLGGQSPLS